MKLKIWYVWGGAVTIGEGEVDALSQRDATARPGVFGDLTVVHLPADQPRLKGSDPLSRA